MSSLTARELDIADLVASGKTNAEIAEALVLSVFTVKNHVSSILMKLDARTRTEAAAVLLSVPLVLSAPLSWVIEVGPTASVHPATSLVRWRGDLGK